MLAEYWAFLRPRGRAGRSSRVRLKERGFSAAKRSILYHAHGRRSLLPMQVADHRNCNPPTLHKYLKQ